MFPTEKLLQCVISLFEGIIRLLTGQDEVTNRLMDRVDDYINKPLYHNFAIEQLSLTWEEVSKVYVYGLEDSQQVRSSKGKI